MPSGTQNTVEQPSAWERLGLASGAAAAVLYLAGAAIFIGLIAPSMPALDAPAVQHTAFYREMAQNGFYRAVSYLGEMQLALLPLFFGALFGLLRRAEGGSASLSSAVFAAGITLAIITPLSIMLEDHLMLGFATAGVDPLIVQGIDGTGPLSFALGGFSQALVLGGTAALLVPKRLLPRWVGWFGGVLIILSLLGTGMLFGGAFFPLAALGMLLFRIWMLLVSLILVQKARTVRQAAPQQLAA